MLRGHTHTHTGIFLLRGLTWLLLFGTAPSRHHTPPHTAASDAVLLLPCPACLSCHYSSLSAQPITCFPYFSCFPLIVLLTAATSNRFLSLLLLFPVLPPTAFLSCSFLFFYFIKGKVEDRSGLVGRDKSGKWKTVSNIFRTEFSDTQSPRHEYCPHPQS